MRIARRPSATRVEAEPYRYIAPAHFAAGKGTPADLKKAFAPVLAEARDPAYTAGDLRLLETLATALKKFGVI